MLFVFLEIKLLQVTELLGFEGCEPSPITTLNVALTGGNQQSKANFICAISEKH